MPRTSISDLSQTSLLGIDVLTRTACVFGSTRIGDVFHFSLKLLLEKGKADLPGLPELHQIHVALEDIPTHAQAIKRRDHDQRIVFVAKVAWHNVALDHKPVNWGAQRHPGLLGSRLSFDLVDLGLAQAECEELVSCHFKFPATWITSSTLATFTP